MNHITNQVAQAYQVPSFNMSHFDMKFAKLIQRLQKLYIQKNHNYKASLLSKTSIDQPFYDAAEDKIAEIEKTLAVIESLIDSHTK